MAKEQQNPPINFEELKREIPYKWRVQSFSKQKPTATCVAYIDARDAMEILDDVVGPTNWQDKYEFVGNKLIAGVGIKSDGEWIWKFDTGVESNTESEKGQFSDAFKRACVKWGIGRFLYDLDVQFVESSGIASQGKYPYVIDGNGKRVWDLTTFINNNISGMVSKTNTGPKPAGLSQKGIMSKYSMDTKQKPPKCSNCSSQMKLVERKDGSSAFWMCPDWRKNTPQCKGLNIEDVDIDGKVIK